MEMIKLDMKGRPFEYPTCILSCREYAKVISEINNDYEMYKNELYPVHYSLGEDNRYYAYFFENHGFSDYNIIKKNEF